LELGQRIEAEPDLMRQQDLDADARRASVTSLTLT
jgi:hypothetical protein